MSTLVTRIGGFEFAIYRDHSSPTRTFGFFVIPQGGSFLDLPFELRSTYSSESGQNFVILYAAECEIRDYINKESSHFQTCADSLDCERCENFSEWLDRRYSDLRGGSFYCAFLTDTMKIARRRRVAAQVKDCGICDAGTLHCDEHSMRLALTR